MSLIGAWLDARAERRFEITGTEGISENPSKPLLEALGGMATPSGITVTERTAQGIPVVFSCDKVIKQDVAKTPIKIKRRLPDGTRKDDSNHPAYVLVHDYPNPVMSPYEFKETMQCALNLWGNAYAEIKRNGRNEPVALWPLDPARMTIDLDDLNRLRYRYRMAVGKPKEWFFDPANPPIFHLRQNALDGIHGRGPVQVLRESMGVAFAKMRYQGKFYGQGGHPRISLSTDQKLTEDAARRVRKDFEALTVGEHNWHRVVVADHGLKVTPIGMPHRDAQFVDLLKLGRAELCGAFRVAPHKVANLERSTNNNIEHQGIEHVTDCLMPHFVCWQQAIARDLLNPRSFNTHFAVFKVDALMRGDFKTLNEGLQLQRQNGVISANDWRRVLDMDDEISEGDGGDLYLVNGNMMPMRRDPAAAVDFDAPTDGVVN